jgi:hypothetical protein
MRLLYLHRLNPIFYPQIYVHTCATGSPILESVEPLTHEFSFNLSRPLNPSNKCPLPTCFGVILVEPVCHHKLRQVSGLGNREPPRKNPRTFHKVLLAEREFM